MSPGQGTILGFSRSVERKLNLRNLLAYCHGDILARLLQPGKPGREVDLTGIYLRRNYAKLQSSDFFVLTNKTLKAFYLEN